MSVRDGRLAASVSEQSCVAPRSVAVFQPTQRQAFLWFLALQVRTTDSLRVEWVDPSGAVSSAVEYGELPNAVELCLTTQLPIAGFAPAYQPGLWMARVSGNGKQLLALRFQITGEVNSGGPLVTSVTWPGVKAQEIDFTVQGKNFDANSLVYIAEYTRSGGWRYLANLRPRSATPNQLTVHYAGLPANEYLVIVENPDQRLSRPMPFVIATTGYKLPMAAGEPWVMTQGPYGAFSHWGNSVHAFDIAPRGERCVVAMKGGIAYTHDLGLRQDHRHRSFGNYITIDHGNGEFSHYAHLATGTFAVRNGQHVEQGQALALAGNSGYTLGEGGGYHVHVSVTRALPITSNSIPFRFEDLRDTPRGDLNRMVVSMNASPLCDCRRQRFAAGASRTAPDRLFAGQLSVEQWWSDLVAVPKGTKTFEVAVSWLGTEAKLNLHLVSPTGRHYGWYGDTTGYSGLDANPQEFRVPKPEVGVWRISVQAVQGGPGPVQFQVTALDAGGAHLVASDRPTRLAR